MHDENTPDVVLTFGTGKTTEALANTARAQGIKVISVDFPVDVRISQLYKIL